MPPRRAISRICNFSRRRMRSREHCDFIGEAGIRDGVLPRYAGRGGDPGSARTAPQTDEDDGRERGLVGTPIALGLMFVGMFFIPLVYTFTSRLDGADYRLPREARESAGGVGMIILAMAVWLFWRSHADLGRNWSPSLELREGHELVTEGVYRSVRHPMYASMWLWGVAQALLLQNWIAGWVSLVMFMPLYMLRVPREERMMLDEFGEEYRAYMDRTGRVIPRLGG